MKRAAAVLCTIVLALAIGLASGQEKTKAGKAKTSREKEMTVAGEVVDVSCYLAHGEKGMGEDHLGCAQACAKAGGPLGILTKEGDLYVSVMPDDHKSGPNAKLIDHIGHHVEATGTVRTKGGVNGMMVTKVAMAPEGEKK